MGSTTMGSLACPLCCGEHFANKQELRYHLLTYADNVYCSGCSKCYDSLNSFIDHLSSPCEKQELDGSDRESDFEMKLVWGSGDESGLSDSRKSDIDSMELDPADAVSGVESQECTKKHPLSGKDMNGVTYKDSSKVAVETNEEKYLLPVMKQELDATEVPEANGSFKNEVNTSFTLASEVSNGVAAKNIDAIEASNFAVTNWVLEDLSVKQHTVFGKTEPPLPIASTSDGVFDSVVVKEEWGNDTASKEEVQEYSCSFCQTTFTSVEDHIQIYHQQQDVLVQVTPEETQTKTCQSDVQNVSEAAGGLIETAYTPADIQPIPDTRQATLEIFSVEKDDIAVNECLIDSEETIRATNFISDSPCLEESSEERTKRHQMEKITAQLNTLTHPDGCIPIAKTLLHPDQPCSANVLECDKCSKQFYFKINFLKHTCLACKICGIVLKSGPFLNDHMFKLHGIGEDTSISCTVCKVKLKSLYFLRKHKCRYCKECDMIFQQGKMMKRHMNVVHGYKDSVKRKKKSPGKRTPVEEIECVVCDATFLNKKDYKKHKKTHTRTYKEKHANRFTSEIFICDTCNYCCRSKRNLLQHMKEHNFTVAIPQKRNTLSWSFICKMCKKSFTSKTELKEHQEEHALNNKVIGKTVEKTVEKKTESNQNQQALEKKGKTVETNQKCNQKECSVENKSREIKDNRNERLSENKIIEKIVKMKQHVGNDRGKSMHQKNHSMVDRVVVQIIGEKQDKYAGKVQAQGHQKSKGTGETVLMEFVSGSKMTVKLTKEQQEMDKEKFTCDVCGKLIHKSDLNIHMKSHGIINIPCDFCFKQFKTVFDFIAHRNLHRSERPYTCARCNKKFDSSKLLAGHLVSHPESQPYGCHFCPERFAKPQARAIHTRIHTDLGRGSDASPKALVT